jgi:hypothetical protein
VILFKGVSYLSHFRNRRWISIFPLTRCLLLTAVIVVRARFTFEALLFHVAAAARKRKYADEWPITRASIGRSPCHPQRGKVGIRLNFGIHFYAIKNIWAISLQKENF